MVFDELVVCCCELFCEYKVGVCVVEIWLWFGVDKLVLVKLNLFMNVFGIFVVVLVCFYLVFVE